MGIKWRKQDLKKLSTYTRKFNAAITRLEKLAPEFVDSGAIPERIDTAELKSRILTRADFNRELRKIDRFFKPGAREIVKDKTGFYTTKWQQKELQYTVARVNAQKRAYIKKYQVPKSQQKFLGLEEINIEKEREKIFNAAAKMEDPEDKINKLQEWFNIAYTLERESSAGYYAETFAKLRNAYFKAIKEHLPDEQAKELIDYLEENNVWGSDIAWIVSQNDILDFEYFYSLEEDEDRATRMLERWHQLMPELKKQGFYKKKKGDSVKS